MNKARGRAAHRARAGYRGRRAPRRRPECGCTRSLLSPNWSVVLDFGCAAAESATPCRAACACGLGAPAAPVTPGEKRGERHHAATISPVMAAPVRIDPKKPPPEERGDIERGRLCAAAEADVARP